MPSENTRSWVVEHCKTPKAEGRLLLLHHHLGCSPQLSSAQVEVHITQGAHSVLSERKVSSDELGLSTHIVVLCLY